MFTHVRYMFRSSTSKLLGRPSNAPPLANSDVKEARAYIANYWSKLTRHHPKDDGSAFGLPYPYLVSAYQEGQEFDFNEMYYWDSYFTAQGLLDSEHKELVVGILENLLTLFKRIRCIPNASRMYLTGRSQPPFLTSFIFDVYNTYNMDLKWLKKSIKIAKQEYETVWMGVTKPHARKVHKGLSRYYDINMTHDLAEAESGWDYNPRFSRRCLDFLPVDLNALLFKYEMDFARAARLFGDTKGADAWEATAQARQATVDELMWDSHRGMYYDYNYVKKDCSNVNSLAAFFPMWAGMASEKQARKLVKNLRRFEQPGGLATTDNVPFGKYVPGAMPMQWAYPNGWAPLEFIVIKALERYGYHEDARRIALKWLRSNLRWFNEHGVFLEKYNVVNLEKPPVKGVYPSQIGFGWTNAIFERLCQEFVDHS